MRRFSSENCPAAKSSCQNMLCFFFYLTIYTPNSSHIIYSHLMQKGNPLQTAKLVTHEIRLKKAAAYRHYNRKCHWQRFLFMYGTVEMLLHHNKYICQADCSWGT